MDKAISIEAGLHNLVSMDEKDEQHYKNLSFHSKVKILLTNITVEPIVLSLILPSIIAIITTQNLTLEKSCRVNLALRSDICDALTTLNDSFPDYKKHEAVVQQLASNMTVWKSIIQSLFPACLLLFLGSWSDRHLKRKPCFMISLMGEMCACIGNLVCTYYFYELPLEVLILSESLPCVFSGGWFSLFLGLYSYIANVTTEEERTVRIGAIHVLYSVSFCVGTSLGGILFQKLGYYGKFQINIFMVNVFNNHRQKKGRYPEGETEFDQNKNFNYPIFSGILVL